MRRLPPLYLNVSGASQHASPECRRAFHRSRGYRSFFQRGYAAALPECLMRSRRHIEALIRRFDYAAMHLAPIAAWLPRFTREMSIFRGDYATPPVSSRMALADRRRAYGATRVGAEIHRMMPLRVSPDCRRFASRSLAMRLAFACRHRPRYASAVC